jgi:hypothetical protein
MTPSTTPYPNASDLNPEDYILIGVATCFVKAEGEVEEITVLEPIPSAALGALLSGIPTSYQVAYGTQLGKILADDGPQKLPAFPKESLFCEDFAERAFAAVRTYRREPKAAEHIPVGGSYDEFNHSTQRKRILNAENIVSKEDNVKQHAYTHQVL